MAPGPRHLAWLIRNVEFDRAMSIGAVVACLAPSIAWPSYELMLVPVIGWLLGRRIWLAAAVVPLWFTPIPGWSEGAHHLTAAIVLGVCVTAAWLLSPDPQPHAQTR